MNALLSLFPTVFLGVGTGVCQKTSKGIDMPAIMKVVAAAFFTNNS